VMEDMIEEEIIKQRKMAKSAIHCCNPILKSLTTNQTLHEISLLAKLVYSFFLKSLNSMPSHHEFLSFAVFLSPVPIILKYN